MYQPKQETATLKEQKGRASNREGKCELLNGVVLLTREQSTGFMFARLALVIHAGFWLNSGALFPDR